MLELKMKGAKKESGYREEGKTPLQKHHVRITVLGVVQGRTAGQVRKGLIVGVTRPSRMREQ